jgi:3D (Asp-Asp-Asp) domain-containing protein
MRRFPALLALLGVLLCAAPAVAEPQNDPLGDLITKVISVPADAVQWLMKATLYHKGAKGVGSRDALGCRPVPMRTAAVDRKLAPLHSILFIPETVGIPLPGGGAHDGYWYASDTGGAIKGGRIDLYTGDGSGSMRGAMKLNLKTLTVEKVGEFKGCPPDTGSVQVASR